MKPFQRIRRVKHVFFFLFYCKNAFLVIRVINPTWKSGFLETKHQTGHEPTREPDFLGFKTNSSESTIPTRLRFSTTIQTATTKNRFRRLSGTTRGCEIVNSDDPTSWIASLSTLLVWLFRRTYGNNLFMTCP